MTSTPLIRIDPSPSGAEIAIEPLVAAERGRNAVYNFAEDHSEGIAKLGAKLAERLPKVKTIDTVLSVDSVFSVKTFQI